MKRREQSRDKRIKGFLIPKLRRMSWMWSDRSRALHAAKRYIEVDRFKNGKPKFKIKFQCAKCKGLFDKHNVSMDHIQPVVPVTGFTTWDSYIDRLFCSEKGYSCLCNSCHSKKTEIENAQRKKHNAK